MSPAAIQKRAGVGQGSMYHHFTGKRELALAALERRSEELLVVAGQLLDSPAPPVERVVAYLERERDPLLGCPVGRLAQDRGVVDDPDLRALVAGLFAELEQRIGSVLSEEESLREPQELAATVIAVLQGGYVLARAADDRTPYDRALAGAIRLLRTTQGAP